MVYFMSVNSSSMWFILYQHPYHEVPYLAKSIALVPIHNKKQAPLFLDQSSDT